jgi:anti-sigma-K factor RskA
MPTAMPSMSIAANVSDRQARTASTSSQTRSADNRTVLWIVVAIVGVTIAAGVLRPASFDDASSQTPTWLVGP